LLNCRNKQKIDAANLLILYLYFYYIIYDINATLWIEKLYGYNKTDDSYVFI